MKNNLVLSFGLSLLGLYFLCVIYPFHFNGYADLPPDGFYYAMAPLGITRYSPIAVCSYFLSSPVTGPLVVVLSISCIFLGTLKKRRVFQLGLSVPAVVIGIFAFANMSRYEIFGLVFE